MKWQLGGDWPVGQFSIPVGTVITEAMKWNGIALTPPMPINAIALDKEAAQMMLGWYPEQQHRLLFGIDVDLDAVKRRHREAGFRV
jgi:hypothetical protein